MFLCSYTSHATVLPRERNRDATLIVYEETILALTEKGKYLRMKPRFQYYWKQGI